MRSYIRGLMVFYAKALRPKWQDSRSAMNQTSGVIMSKNHTRNPTSTIFDIMSHIYKLWATGDNGQNDCMPSLRGFMTIPTLKTQVWNVYRLTW